eukprot:4325514-Lingulodinium_polyedra.AAC.1
MQGVRGASASKDAIALVARERLLRGLRVSAPARLREGWRRAVSRAGFLPVRRWQFSARKESV